MNKRIYSLVIGIVAAVLILGMSCSVFAADNTAETDLLKALNIIDNTEDAEMPITRVDFLKMALKLADEYDIAANYEAMQVFKDVPANNENAAVIAYAYDSGYIIGWDGQYEPDRNILLGEANTVLIRVTDYTFMSQEKGAAFVISSTGMNDGIDAAEDAAITRADAFKMIYNMLEVPYYEQLSAGGKITISKDSEHDMLEYFHDVQKARGILTAAKTISLTDSSYKSDYAIINGESFLCSAYNAEEYVGQEVVYYYRVSSGNYNDIIAVQAGRNRILELDATDLMINEVDYGETKIVYTNENNKKSEAKLDKYVDVIYNKEAYADFEPEDLKIREGTLKLIDNDNNGVYDVIVVEKADSIVIKSMNAGDRTLIPEVVIGGKTKYELGNSSGQDVVIYGADGSYYEFGDIAEGNVATIFQSKSGKKATVYIAVNVINGQIEKVRNKEPRNIITVGGKDYEVDRDYAAAVGDIISVDTKTGLYLDMYDRIVGVGETSGKFKNYGFIFAIAKPQNVIQNNYRIKIFTEGGTFAEGTLKDKLLWGKDDSQVTAEQAYNNITAVGTNVPVVYEMNNKNEITSIDLAEDMTDDKNVSNYGSPHTDIFSLDAKTDGTQNITEYRSGIFGGKYRIDANTVVFGIPNVDSPAIYDEAEYTMMSQSNFTVNNSNYELEIYDLDETYCAGLIISKPITVDPNFGESRGGLFIVDKVATGLDEDGEKYTVVSGWCEGNYVEYPITNDEALKSSVAALQNPKQGDVCRIKINNRKIEAVNWPESLANVTMDSAFHKNYASDDSEYTGSHTYGMLGRVGALKNGAFVVKCPNSGYVAGTPGVDPEITVMPNSITSARVYLYDRANGEITLSNVGNIEAETSYGAFNGSLVYATMKYNSVEDIVIIKD